MVMELTKATNFTSAAFIVMVSWFLLRSHQCLYGNVAASVPLGNPRSQSDSNLPGSSSELYTLALEVSVTRLYIHPSMDGSITCASEQVFFWQY